jgi:hypothetical protein
MRPLAANIPLIYVSRILINQGVTRPVHVHAFLFDTLNSAGSRPVEAITDLEQEQKEAECQDILAATSVCGLKLLVYEAFSCEGGGVPGYSGARALIEH